MPSPDSLRDALDRILPVAERAMAPLPKLTKPQMARLVEIARNVEPFAIIRPKTSMFLMEACLIEGYRPPPPEPQFTRLRLTPLGISILAGLPGDEFDRFRDLLAGRIAIDAREESHAR